MNYSEPEFFALLEAVEGQGGEHLDEQCKAKRYEFVGSDQKPVTLPSCGNNALFHVPYEARDADGMELGLHPLRVCAVEDDMGRWPRFGGDRFAGPEFYVKPKED